MDIAIIEEPEPEWYAALVEECKAIVTESVFTSRWALVEGYHQLGERIVTDGNFQKFAKGNGQWFADLRSKIGVSESTLYRAIQFYELYPRLDEVPEGKNISWNKIITKYLPKPEGEEQSSPTLAEEVARLRAELEECRGKLEGEGWKV